MKIKFDPVFVGVITFYCLLERSVLPLYVVVAALLHEIGHFAVIKRLKYPVSAFEIQPIGFKIVEGSACKSYLQDIAVAAGGPITNLTCAAIIYIFSAIVKTETTAFAIAINLTLFAVNMLPIGVLDGGRIVYALLAQKFGILAADAIMPKISFSFSLLLIVLGIAIFAASGYNFSLLLIGIYLLISGRRT